MKYVGVDIGKRRHAVGAVDEMGKVIMNPRTFTQNAGGFASISDLLNTLGGPTQVLVAMEATGPYWRVLRHHLARAGYRVDVINPLITSREASADVRGRKTDKLDALAIARAAIRGGHHPAPPEDPAFDSLRAYARQRQHLVGRRSDAKRRLEASLDVVFPEAAAALGDLFSRTALAVLAVFPSARLLASADRRRLHALFAKTLGRERGRTLAEAVRTAAAQSVALSLVIEGEEFIISQLIGDIRALDAQIDQVELRLKACLLPEAARWLQSIKGAGQVHPRIIAAELGDLQRFAGPQMASRILAFAGAEPRIRESGKWKGHSKMSKRGSPTLRHSLYLLATTVRLHTPYFNQIYKHHIAKGKHHTVALSHVMRKLVEVMCGMYKTQTPFCAPEWEATPCA